MACAPHLSFLVVVFSLIMVWIVWVWLCCLWHCYWYVVVVGGDLCGRLAVVGV